MVIELFLMLWLTTLVFTIASFIWRDIIFFPIIAFVLWQGCALLGGNITYVGFGSINYISQSYEAGDPELGTSLIWIMHGIGLMMLVFGFGQLWTDFRSTGNKLMSGRRVDTL